MIFIRENAFQKVICKMGAVLLRYIKACEIIHILIKGCDVIAHPCPNFNGGLVKPPLMLWYGWEMTNRML